MRFSARTMLPEPADPALGLLRDPPVPQPEQREETQHNRRREKNQPHSPVDTSKIKLTPGIRSASMATEIGPMIVTIPIPISRSRHPFMIGRQSGVTIARSWQNRLPTRQGGPTSVSFTTTPATPSRKQRYRKHCLRTEFGFASQPSCTTTTPRISSGMAAA